MKPKIPNYIKFIFLNAFSLFVFILVFRFIFFGFFAQLDDVSFIETRKAFLLGIRFDVKLAILTIFPLAILILIINYRFFQYKIYRKIASLYLIISYVVLTLFFLTDFGFYEYLGARLDATSLKFLTNLKISGQVLVESYPVYKGFIGLLFLGFLSAKLIGFIYGKFNPKELKISKKGKAGYIIFTVLFLSFGVYNSTSHYPLRWSEAFFSKNNRVNQFALNPILYFFDSFAFRSESVQIDKLKEYYPVIAKHLHLPKDTLQFERKITFENPYKEKPNVIFVMLESVGVAPMSYYGNSIKTTPVLDSLIQTSLSFPKFYIHKSGTAASVFASITGLPDIDEVNTVSRNPLAIDQRIIFDQYKDYEKLYFLGGSANWANIRGIFQSNITDLKIFEEGSYDIENRADVWGIDDYELFKESDKELAKLHQKKKPFVAYIQTASNHMPFSVPDKKENYRPLKESDIDQAAFKKSGFKSIAQINALRYLDFNIGVFLERAKKSGYYENTIFAFFGDHNTAMNKLDFSSKLEYDLDILLRHVPLIIHSPKFIAPKEINKFGKLVDLFPTVTSLAKINYTNYTLGSDLLDSTYTNTAGFLYLSIKGEPAVSLLQNDFYYTKTSVSKQTSLYDLTSKKIEDVKREYPETSRKMDSLLTAFFHSTKYLYFNNKKLRK
jgi:phosphoglycerol transferase MdoB-like AlkP superfamily enzyme